MLQKIRDNAHGWWAYVVVPIFVLLFAFFGVGNYLTGNLSVADAAKVNGEVLSFSDFANLYQQVNRAQNPSQDPGVANYLKVQVLQNLINQELFYQALTRLGFAVSPMTIDSIIAQMPAFQDQGKFSMAQYQAALQNAGITTENLRDSLTKAYLVQQMQAGLLTSQFSLPQEVSYETTLANLIRDVNYVVITPNLFARQVNVTDADVAQYYQTHQLQFMTPYQVKLAYVTLSAAQFQKPGLDSEHAAALYQNALSTLSTQAFQSPTSLDAAAHALNLQVQTTGWLDTSKQVGVLSNPQVLTAVMSDGVLNGGNNSGLIANGKNEVIVVRVLDKKIPMPIPFNQLAVQLKNSLVLQQELQAATNLAKQMQAGIASGQSMAALAQANQLTVQTVTGINANSKNLNSTLLAAFTQAPLQQALITPGNNQIILFQVTKSYLPQKLTTQLSGTAISGLWMQVEMGSFLAHLQDSAKVKINDQLIKGS